MTLIAPHIAAFLQQRLPVERQASPNTCDSYADAFRLLFAYASNYLKIAPSQLQLEHIDAVLITNFLNHLEAARKNGAALNTSCESMSASLKNVALLWHRSEYRRTS